MFKESSRVETVSALLFFVDGLHMGGFADGKRTAGFVRTVRPIAIYTRDFCAG